MKPVEYSNSILNIQANPGERKKNELIRNNADSAEISNTAKVFDRIDRFLNLGRPDRLKTDDLNDSEKKEFLKILADLIRKGIVGYEILEVNGKPEKHFIVNEIGDQRLYGAKLYKKGKYYKD